MGRFTIILYIVSLGNFLDLRLFHGTWFTLRCCWLKVFYSGQFWPGVWSSDSFGTNWDLGWYRYRASLPQVSCLGDFHYLLSSVSEVCLQ